MGEGRSAVSSTCFLAIGVGVSLAAVAAASFLQSSGRTRASRRLERTLWWSRTLSRRRIKLVGARVPVAVLSSHTEGSHSAIFGDDEGLVETTITIESGKLVAISLRDEDETPRKAAQSSTSSWLSAFSAVMDCRGAIVIPCFSDAHTHLVKTEIVPRNRNFSGTVSEALAAEVMDQPRWKEKISRDVVRRMEFAVQCALHHGTRSIRTHLDGCVSEATQVQMAVWDAFDGIRDTYADVLTVQGVANLYLPQWLLPMAATFAEKAKSHVNVVLGAYVGNPSKGNQPDSETMAAMDALFGHAHRLDMDVDLHIDESNDPQCCVLASLCQSLSKARQAGYNGRVVLGHCCSLSLQDKSTQDAICSKLAQLDAFVVCNPFTNLGLQDRRDSRRPHSLSIPDVPRTPQWRGLTLLQELRASGVTVACASDNVRDHWYPYGDYDMLAVWNQTQAMGHLDTVPSEGSWADLVTVAPAEAMGLSHSMAVGQVADLVLFPSARRMSELFARPQVDRIVLRKGRLYQSRLPDFAELDDLVAEKTEQVASLEEELVMAA